MYARKLTKEDLLRDGITKVTEDGRVFRGDRQELPRVSNAGYFIHNIFDLDENGERIKVDAPKSAFGYTYKYRSLGLHRLMWAWFYDEVPDGMVVDHIDNKHSSIEDYRLDNLQLLTPSENIRKNRAESTAELRCKKDRPRIYYEDKLKKTLAEYEKAKLKKDTEYVHLLRTKVFQIRARLRYWDSHKEEIEANIALKEAKIAQKAERSARLADKRALRELADKAKEMNNYSQWHTLLDVIKNYDLFSEAQIKKIIKTNKEKCNAQ